MSAVPVLVALVALVAVALSAAALVWANQGEDHDNDSDDHTSAQ